MPVKSSSVHKFFLGFPLGIVVFLQALIIAVINVTVPLVISVRSANLANQLSINTGANASFSLGQKIQRFESAQTQVLINDVMQAQSDLLSDFTRLATSLNYINLTNYDMDGKFKYCSL